MSYIVAFNSYTSMHIGIPQPELASRFTEIATQQQQHVITQQLGPCGFNGQKVAVSSENNFVYFMKQSKEAEKSTSVGVDNGTPWTDKWPPGP